ncbi:MAG: sigma-70 family RNA polymerase sigma factor [Caldilinea sp. CFX5]|nr:sigma-70 family RNA polymerase sigma factor [Caldilinea sp. CFX5]
MNTYDSLQLLAEKTLMDLLGECQEKMAAYRSGLVVDSASCAEIVRRAVVEQNMEARGILLERISKPIIMRRCQRKYPELLGEIEDIVQEINLRLLQKFNNRSAPFRVSTFAEYCSYVNITLHHFVLNLKRQQQRVPLIVSFPDENEQYKYQAPAGLTIPSPANEIERRLLWQQILSKLPNPQVREVLERYYGLGESTAEIAEIMGLETRTVTALRLQGMTAVQMPIIVGLLQLLCESTVAR